MVCQDGSMICSGAVPRTGTSRSRKCCPPKSLGNNTAQPLENSCELRFDSHVRPSHTELYTFCKDASPLRGWYGTLFTARLRVLLPGVQNCPNSIRYQLQGFVNGHAGTADLYGDEGKSSLRTESEAQRK